MTACGGGGGSDNSKDKTPIGGSGTLDGTWVDIVFATGEISNPPNLTLIGSNYTLTGDVTSSGTYTLASDGKDLAFKETSSGSKTYKGYYHKESQEITANFSGGNVFLKKQE